MHIRLANDNEKIERDRLAFDAWGKPLSMDQFLERERRLRQCPWAAGRMQTWVAEEDGAIVSSCETFRMDSRLKGDRGSTYGIASVYTEQRFRGRGFASQMLARVVAEIETRDRRAQAFILYSEVGASIYERVGFVARPITAWVAPASGPSLSSDKAHIVEDFSRWLTTYNAVEDTYRILPTRDQLGWFWEREAVYAEFLGKPRPSFHMLDSDDAFSVWIADYKNSYFRALVFQAVREKSAAAMLESARLEAQRIGLGAVKVWNTPGCKLRGNSALKQVSLEDTLPMIRPAVQCRMGWEPALWREISRVLWV